MLNIDKSTETNKNEEKFSYLSHSSDDWPLDNRFKFEKFIIGVGQMRWHIPLSKRFCSLTINDFNHFIFMVERLGKTHLLHAIAWELKEENKVQNVLYLSAERFMFQFIKSLRQKDTMSFKQKFRSADVLVLDDIQFMIRKTSTQEEFFYTFNTLLDMGKS